MDYDIKRNEWNDCPDVDSIAGWTCSIVCTFTVYINSRHYVTLFAKKNRNVLKQPVMHDVFAVAK